MAQDKLASSLGDLLTQKVTINSVANQHIPARYETNTSGNPIRKQPVKIRFTPTIDTSAHAVGDVLFDYTAVADVFDYADATGYIVGFEVLTKADVAFGLEITTFYASVTFGTINAAPDPTDTEALEEGITFQMPQSILRDRGANRKMAMHGLYVPVKAISGTTSLGLAATILEGTPTFANGDIVCDVWVQ